MVMYRDRYLKIAELAQMRQTLVVKCQEIIQQNVSTFVARNLTTTKIFKDLFEYQSQHQRNFKLVQAQSNGEQPNNNINYDLSIEKMSILQNQSIAELTLGHSTENSATNNHLLHAQLSPDPSLPAFQNLHPKITNTKVREPTINQQSQQ